MSRLRTLKPGFFVDEELAECSPLARLLFAGLWTIADREGRLEDRPKRIRVQVLPYDDCDVDALLWELSRGGFIVRYEVGGLRYVAIPTWSKHQSPHVNEAASTIPAPEEHGASTIQAPEEHPPSCLGSCLGSGVLSSDNGEREEHSLSTRNGSFRAAHEEDFEAWWSAFGRVGTRKARAGDLYRWWLENGATADQLLTAARSYRAYCSSTSTISMHATTFLAKPARGKSPIWPEWAAGEPHGSMDASGAAHLSDVLAAGGLTFGLNGGRRVNGHREQRRLERAAEHCADAGGGLPAVELESGE